MDKMEDDSSGAVEMIGGPGRRINGFHSALSTRDVNDDDILENDDDFVDDEHAVLETREPFAWADQQVKRQNRCFVFALMAILLAAGTYVIGIAYLSDESALEGDKYDAKTGILTDNFEGAKAQDLYEQEHGAGAKSKENPFGNQNAFEHGNGQLIANLKNHSNTHGVPGGLPSGRPERPVGDGTGSGGIRNHNGIGRHPANPNGSAAGSGHGTGDGGPKPQSWRCDHSGYEDWLDATVTLDDGVKYEVVETIDHDHSAFVQGLTYAHGTLWESNGLYGESTVRILDPDSADVIKNVFMPRQLFGEGMTYSQGKLYQITWKSKKGFIYNATTLDVIDTFQFHTTTGEGWGITWHPCQREFVVTDGSKFLHFWDKDTLAEKHKVAVTRMDGSEARDLNEIEWYRGKILANVWYKDILLVIDPTTGQVEKEYDFSELFPRKERAPLGCDVFNGISVSQDPDILYVTGKKWDRMFKIRLLS